MSPERWEQIQKIFDEARLCEPDQRAALLEEACKDDGELRREIEWMLAHQDEAKNFIQTPALEVAAMSIASDGSSHSYNLPAHFTKIAVGARLGSYEITDVLGKGGMGEVYRARDSRLKRDVAIKILPNEFNQDPDRVRRFQREAEALASLNHPNIAVIYDLQEDGGTRFLIMELVEGESLASRVVNGRLRVDEALRGRAKISSHLSD